ncbi:MAG: signal peptidase I [Lachnospiraceae bacterium]
MLKKVCGFLSTILLIVLAAIAISLFVPRLLGYETMAVVSGSMEPGIPVGSVVYVKKDISPEDLKVKDVVTYQLGGNTRVTHRIAGIDAATGNYITKGDANDTEDAEPVTFAQIVGKMAFSIPLLGYISIYIKTPLGIAAVAAVVFILLLLMFLPDIFTKETKHKEKSK